MTSLGRSILIIFTTFVIRKYTYGYSHQFCSVFQPFKVTPENAKFQIGGIFPLHDEDCMHVRPSTVQELIAVQWALSHWNQNPGNADFKLAISALDTCSRKAESLGQTVTFLNKAGFFSPEECYAPDKPNFRVPLGLVLPSFPREGLNSMTGFLNGIQLPLITYSATTAQALFNVQMATAFSTAPGIHTYIQAITTLLKELKSNHVTLIYSDEYIGKETLDQLVSSFAKSGAIITELLEIDDATGAKLASDESSNIVIMMTTKKEFQNFISSPKIAATALQKLYINALINGEGWNRSEITDQLIPKASPAQILIFQQSSLFDVNQFRAYFLDILRNNYQSYSLLASYMESVYNCTLIGEGGLTDCEKVDSLQLLDGFTFNAAVESAVLATYAFGNLAKAMFNHPDNPCAKPSPACAKASIAYLKDMVYDFGDFDPEAYRGFKLRFGEDKTAKSMKIEGLYVRRSPQFTVDVAMNYSTNGDWSLGRDSIRWASSWCQPWRAKCNADCRMEKPYEAERMWLQKSGQLYIMGIFDIRQYDSDALRCNDTITDPVSVAMPAAFVYVLETIRQKYPDFDILPGVELGGILLDACQDPIAAVQPIIASANRQCFDVAETAERNEHIPSSNIAAFASGQKITRLDTIKLLFADKSGVRKPLITADGDYNIRGITSSEKNVVSDDDFQARVILELLIKQDWDYVSVLLSDHDEECVRAYEAFRRLVERDDRICISDVVYSKGAQSIESVNGAPPPATRVVLSFTTASDAVSFLKATASQDSRQDNRPVFIFLGEAHDWQLGEEKGDSNLVSKWNAAIWGSISIQPRAVASEDFRAFLSTINPKRLPEEWFIRFWEDYFQCVVSENAKEKRRACSGDERLPTEMFGRLTREAHFMLGIEKFIFGLDGLYKQACPDRGGLCEAFFRGGYQEKVMEMINRTPKADPQYMIYNYRPKLGGAEYVQIGAWSGAEGLKLNDSWTWYDGDGRANATFPGSTCRPPLCRCKLENDFFIKPIQSVPIAESNDDDRPDNSDHRDISKILRPSVQSSHSHGVDISGFTVKRNQWKRQPCSYIFLILNTLLLIAAVLVLGLVVVKLCSRVVKGNQSLGICLLCGVILLYSSVYFFILDSCELMCRLRYISHSSAYSICFGVMIAKAVQLKNSETIGFTGHVSYWNYWLLLFFIVAVQVALNMQWAALREPVIVSFLVEGASATPSILLHCSWTSEEFLASQIYVVILLSLALFLSMMNRNVKRNYKETRWLMYTSLICAPIWIIWMIAYAFAPDPFKDTVIVMQLITCASVVLCFMFGPKLYILLSYEPVLIQYPPGFKLELGNGTRSSNLEKNNVVDLTGNYNDFGAMAFGDVDDDCHRSVISSDSSSTKSTGLSHTLSCASSITSYDSSMPVYQAVIRNKSRSKKVKVDPSNAVRSISSDGVQRRDVFGETVASVH